MMSTDPQAARLDPAAYLAFVAALLARASDITWIRAQADPDPGLRFRGLAIDLAADQVLNLLLAGTDVNDVAGIPVTDVVGDNPVELIRAAEATLRQRPIEDFPVGTSHLIVSLCDLIAEHAP